MGFYITLIVFLTLSGVLLQDKNKNLKFLYMLIVISSLTAISALRSNVIGNDTQSYIDLFNSISSSVDVFSLVTRIEKGFLVLIKYIHILSNSQQFFIVFTSLIIVSSSVLIFYRKSAIFWLTIILYINLRFYFFNLSGLRQSIAMVILLIAYECYISKRKKSFYLLLLLASSFHISSIIFILLVPLSKIKISKKYLMINSMICLFVFMFFNKFIVKVINYLPSYSHYLSSVYFEEGIKIASVFNFAMLLLLLVISILVIEKKKIRLLINKDNEINILLHLVIISIFMSFLSIRFNLLDRLVMYFSIFYVYFIPKIIVNIESKSKKVFLLYFVLVATFLYNMSILYLRPEWQSIYPYKTFFGG